MQFAFRADHKVQSSSCPVSQSTGTNKIKLVALSNMHSPPTSIFNSLHSFLQFIHETDTKHSLLFYLFYLYVYPPDSQESNKGTNA